MLLLNQIGGGSLRIYKRDIQEKVLEIVGISPEQVQFQLVEYEFIAWFRI